MRIGAFVAASTLLLVGAAAQSTLLESDTTNAHPAITACADAGDTVQGDCTPSPLGGPPTFESYTVLDRGCSGGDLHVMSYRPGSGAAPVVATWCR